MEQPAQPQLPLRRRIWLERLPVLAGALVLAVQLLVPPVVGLANNGDFGKVLAPFSLAALEADEFRYAPVRYTFDPSHQFWLDYYSSAQILAALAIDLHVLVSPMLSRDGAFDLRLIGLVHSAILLIAFFYAPRRLWAGLFAVLVFGDAMYASQLNSFYMGTASLVFLMLTVMAYMRGWGHLLVCASLLLVTSKAQHALLGVLIVALIVADRTRLGLRGTGLAASIVALVFAVWFAFASAPEGYSTETRFDAVFYRIIAKSREPAADLRALGLDESWLKYSGMFAYSKGSPLEDPERREEFRKRSSYTAIGQYYLVRPAYVLRDVLEALGEAGRQRPILGNFDRKYALPPFTESRRFTLWSDFKRSVFDKRGGLALVYFCALAMVGAWLARGHSMQFGMWALITAGFLTMGVAALADSLDMPRHFLLYHAIADLLLVMCAALATEMYMRKIGANPRA